MHRLEHAAKERFRHPLRALLAPRKTDPAVRMQAGVADDLSILDGKEVGQRIEFGALDPPANLVDAGRFEARQAGGGLVVDGDLRRLIARLKRANRHGASPNSSSGAGSIVPPTLTRV